MEYLQKSGETTLEAADFDFTAPGGSTRPGLRRRGLGAARTDLEKEHCQSKVQELQAQNGAEVGIQNIQSGNGHLEDATSPVESTDLVTEGTNPEQSLKTKRKGADGKSVQTRKRGKGSERRNQGDPKSKRQRRISNTRETKCVQTRRGHRQTDTRGADPVEAGKALPGMPRARLRAVAASLRELPEEGPCSRDTPAASPGEKSSGLGTGAGRGPGQLGRQDVTSGTEVDAEPWDRRSLPAAGMAPGACVQSRV